MAQRIALIVATFLALFVVSTTASAQTTLAISPGAGALPAGAAGAAYSQAFGTSGGSLPYTYAISAGAPPAGVTLSAGGVLSGVPKETGNFTFSITATDGTSAGSGGPLTATELYSMVVGAPTIVVGPATFINATVGVSYLSMLNVGGGTAPYTFSSTGALPTGLTFDATGRLSGTPTETGSFNFQITATDSTTGGGPYSGSRNYTLAVAAPTINLAPATLPNAAAGAAYSQTLAASGGTPAYSYAVTAGSLPTGLSLDPSGTITGTPTAGGTFNFTVIASDSSTGPGSPFAASQAYTVTVDPALITLSPATLPNWDPHRNYNQTVSASGGNGLNTFAVTSGSLPPGWTLSPTGLISGVATEANVLYNFTITATDQSTGAGAPYSGSQAYSVIIGSPSFSLTAPVLAANVGIPYSGNFVAGGGLPPYTFSRFGGTLPPGLSLAADGTLSGIPITTGTFNFSVVARDTTPGPGAPYGIVSGYTFTVGVPTLSLSPGSLPGGTVGIAYTQTLTTSGGVAPYSYSNVGALAPGLSLDGTSGTISGTPTSGGTFTFTIAAQDSSGGGPYTVSRSYTLAVAIPTITLSPASLANGVIGSAYAQTLTAAGGTAPYSYRVAYGALPPGIALDGATGQLTASALMPAAVGSYAFTIEARDLNGLTGTRAYSITVTANSVTVRDQVFEVPAGTVPANVDLAAGATGGPFTSAELVPVSPPNAGTASIVTEDASAGGTPRNGWFLRFVPNPAFGGSARVGYRLVSPLGRSNLGQVIFRLSFDTAAVSTMIDRDVQSFVRQRQQLLASSIEVPDLVRRRRVGAAMQPVTSSFSPLGDGMFLNFASSTSQISAAHSAIDRMAPPPVSPLNVWVDGIVTVQMRENNNNQWGSFGVFSTGIDYLLNNKALIGFSLHVDQMSDPTSADARATGTGWLAGPYASIELHNGVFWDSSVRVGGSGNSIDGDIWGGIFNTRRWTAETSVTGVWDLDAVTTFAPKLRAVYLSETVESYRVENGAGGVIDIDGFTSEQFRVSLGAELARQFTLGNGLLFTPSLDLTGGLSALSGASAFGAIGTGLSFQAGHGWALKSGLSLSLESGGNTSASAKLSVNGEF